SVELINGFKQLAVDQSSYHRRVFDLKTVVDEVLLTISPTLRRTPHTVRLEVPPQLEMDSFPGPLGQVLINLINNAVTHGFDGATKGTVVVAASAEAAEHMVLTVQDNGVGIAAANIDRIFDPFFTTRMGQGGSGLGLHICFSLVNGLLGGSISAASHASGGACFTLRLPRTAPQQ
ncbi:MAG TPA: HAMP domain-containing sensor histidine kinase, partial [Rhodoferax sp.]|nr:HAMP domain-containing sensor histidine kinase [Rhodoferax sp.]